MTVVLNGARRHQNRHRNGQAQKRRSLSGTGKYDRRTDFLNSSNFIELPKDFAQFGLYCARNGFARAEVELAAETSADRIATRRY